MQILHDEDETFATQFQRYFSEEVYNTAYLPYNS